MQLLASQQGEVGDAIDGHGAAIGFRMEGRAGQGGITSVARAHDADAGGIDAALGGHRGDAVQQIGLHLPGPLLAAGRLEGVAKARRAAELGLQHRIAARGEELGPPVEFELVPRGRSPVRQDDEGGLAGSRAGRRQGQIGAHLQPVPGLVGDPACLSETGPGQFRIGGADRRQLPLGRVEQEPLRRKVRGLDADHDAAAVLRPVREPDPPAGKGVLELGVQAPHGGVEPDFAGAVGVRGEPERNARVGIGGHRGDDLGVGLWHGRLDAARQGMADHPVAAVGGLDQIDGVVGVGIAEVFRQRLARGVAAPGEHPPGPGALGTHQDLGGAMTIVVLEANPWLALGVDVPARRGQRAVLDRRPRPARHIDPVEGGDEGMVRIALLGADVGVVRAHQRARRDVEALHDGGGFGSVHQLQHRQRGRQFRDRVVPEQIGDDLEVGRQHEVPGEMIGEGAAGGVVAQLLELGGPDQHKAVASPAHRTHHIRADPRGGDLRPVDRGHGDEPLIALAADIGDPLAVGRDVDVLDRWKASEGGGGRRRDGGFGRAPTQASARREPRDPTPIHAHTPEFTSQLSHGDPAPQGRVFPRPQPSKLENGRTAS